MRIVRASDRKAIDRLASTDAACDPAVLAEAARIVRDVRRRGDRAVSEWTRRLDRRPESQRGPAPKATLEVLSPKVLRAGRDATPRSVRAAIRLAAVHIRRVAEAQLPRSFAVRVCPGILVEQRVQPFARVGCYVPGGRHPLPSTLLMTAIPARVAGVAEVVVMCPRPDPAVLCAALEAGVSEVRAIGGAQAIAAMAYGTRSIARVDKIVGPGNAWVAAAKSLVSADCAVDVHAGPSEIVVWSDRGRAAWIAADLLAQAEHDPDARAILVTTRPDLARRVAAEVARQAPRTGPARAALARHGALILARNHAEAVATINRLAPEHLVCDRAHDADDVRAAGTVFIGSWSAQAAGDYCTGSNHVLPTGGAARFRGGLSAADFVRTFSVQAITRRGLHAIGPSVIALAGAEGLTSHAASIRIRLERNQ
jgi:histidinol dehydrogenase